MLIYKERKYTRELIQSVKSLPGKYETLSSEPQDPDEKHFIHLKLREWGLI